MAKENTPPVDPSLKPSDPASNPLSQPVVNDTPAKQNDPLSDPSVGGNVTFPETIAPVPTASEPGSVTLTKEQFEALLNRQQPPVTTSVASAVAEKKDADLHQSLEEVYGPGYVTTTKQMGGSTQVITQYWRKESWEALEEDKDKDGKPLGTKGGHKKVVKVPDFLKNLPNGGVGTTPQS